MYIKSTQLFSTLHYSRWIEEPILAKEENMIQTATVNLDKEILMERSSRCLDMGKKFRRLFLLVIATIIMTVITYVCVFYALSSEQALTSVSLIPGIVIIVLAVVYGATLISLGSYHDEFSSAGIFYILAQISSVLNSRAVGFFGLVTSLMYTFFGIMYVLKLAAGMEVSFEIVDVKMAGKWEVYKKIFLTVNLLSLVNALCIISSGYGSVNFYGGIALAMASVVVSIWQIVLLGQSARAMEHYVNCPQ